jgi:hypothetical protein
MEEASCGAVFPVEESPIPMFRADLPFARKLGSYATLLIQNVV